MKDLSVDLCGQEGMGAFHSFPQLGANLHNVSYLFKVESVTPRQEGLQDMLLAFLVKFVLHSTSAP